MEADRAGHKHADGGGAGENRLSSQHTLHSTVDTQSEYTHSMSVVNAGSTMINAPPRSKRGFFFLNFKRFPPPKKAS